LSRPVGLRKRERFLLAEATTHHQASSEADSVQIDEFFKAILASKSLKPDEKREFEAIARTSAENRSHLDEAQHAAAHQARKMYRCGVCGLEFIGILSFTEHGESTSHMRNQGNPW